MKLSKIFCLVAVALSVVIIFSFSVAHAAEEYEILIAQGIQKINDGNYNEALELLNRALSMAPDNQEARYYSAVAMSRLGKMDEAEQLLTKMLAEGAAEGDVYFELGRIAYVKGDCKTAEDYLSRFVESTDDESRRSYAGSLIDDCYAAEKAATAEKPYRLNITAGFEYDDNVVIEPNNPVIAADRDDDGRLVLLLNGGAVIAETDLVCFRGDYLVYQSAHFDLDDFNVHYQKPSLSTEWLFSKIVRPTAGYRFEYIRFGDDTYGIANTLFGELNIRESKSCDLDLIYEYSENKYWDTELFETNRLRTGRKVMAGVKQNFSWKGFEGDIHYFHEDKRARVNYWEYKSNKIGATLGYQIIDPLLIKVSGDFNRREHDDNFPGFKDDRVDKMQKYTIRLTYAYTDKIAISLTDRYTRNDSNMGTYDYDRNIIGLLVTFGLI